MKKKVNVYVSVCVFKTLPVYLKLAQLCQSTILQKKKKNPPRNTWTHRRILDDTKFVKKVDRQIKETIYLLTGTVGNFEQYSPVTLLAFELWPGQN